MLLAPDKLSAAGVGGSEEHFAAAMQHVSPGLAAKAAA